MGNGTIWLVIGVVVVVGVIVIALIARSRAKTRSGSGIGLPDLSALSGESNDTTATPPGATHTTDSTPAPADTKPRV